MSKTSPAQQFIDILWRWFIAPSAQIQGRDQRRLATLLSILLLALIFLAVIVESITVAFIQEENYTGYRQTIASVCVMVVIYILSRTRHVRITGVLTSLSVSFSTFIVSLAQPSGVLGGLLDYLIISIWLGSLFLKPFELALLIAANLIGLLAFPLLAPAITLNDILVGPFSFVLVTSILMILISRYRNLLEQDRRVELAENEQHSRREAARVGVLLRVAGYLNAHLDLDTLLIAINEEVARALNTPVALVVLYDPKQNVLYSAAGLGVPPNLIGDLPRLPRELYDRAAAEYGTVFIINGLQKDLNEPYFDQFKKLDVQSLAFATMTYDHGLIGGLCAIALGKSRNFTEEELQLLQGLADQAALAIVNTRLYKDAHRRLKNLQALRAIDTAITSNHDLGKTLDLLLDKIIEQLDVDAAVFLLLDEASQELYFAASYGINIEPFRYKKVRLGEGVAGRAAQQKEIIYIRDLDTDQQAVPLRLIAGQQNFVSYYAIPLIVQGEVKGVLEIFKRAYFDSNKEWLNFLEALAGQAAIAIESTTLFENLQRSNDELSKAYESTIEGWSHALDLRDKETEGHTRRVTELTEELAKAFGFKGDDLVHIRRGSLLHDIGKMGVPDRILLKETALEPEEWEQMKQHPAYALEMLKSIQYLHQALDIPHYHHERWDGSGYPHGLKGEAIPLTARIFAIVDVWDAITSDRPYRAAWSPEKALAHIKAESGKHFDPHVVEMFTYLIEKKNHEKI